MLGVQQSRVLIYSTKPHEPELALQKACRKFERRFRRVEKLILNKDGSLENATLDEMEKLWQ